MVEFVHTGHCGCRSDRRAGRAGHGNFAVMDDSSHPIDVTFHDLYYGQGKRESFMENLLQRGPFP